MEKFPTMQSQKKKETPVEVASAEKEASAEETPAEKLKYLPKSDPFIEDAKGPLDEILRLTGHRLSGELGSITSKIRWFKDKFPDLDETVILFLNQIVNQAHTASEEIEDAVRRSHGLSQDDWKDVERDHIQNFRIRRLPHIEEY